MADLSDPDRALALATVPPATRQAVAVLWALDERLAGIVAATREPALGLMRLVWWRDALDALAAGAPGGEPLLAACAAAGLDGPALAATAAGWEALLDNPETGDAAVAAHAVERGERLFLLSGALIGAAHAEEERLRAAGNGWARVDCARRLGRTARAAAIRAGAVAALERAMAERWPRRLRPLGQLAALALADCGGSPPAGRARALRVLRHQLTGR
ncbi:squalene/phytoene synthase family protein [Sphingomonas sp.]|uniref:squalene/phytoene synthase family protein n=1 Tax=Sphingomonas sp. TaxID=28214 RepID=UPI003B00F7AD